MHFDADYLRWECGEKKSATPATSLKKKTELQN